MNYKKLGDYIQPVDERNINLEDLPLVGLSISKKFINSVANIIGTDLSNYKIIQNKQFACSLMQVSRDEKIPISMYSDDRAIMSPAYPIFEVKDTSELMPEYLMMWFSRSEFDRQAAFFAVGGIRGNLPWEDFCELEFPLKPIEKQREIVKEYNTIQNRIDLNNRLIQKLEETAQAIYKEWFVEFEFPDANGNPYKSSGGEMVWNEELGKEVPDGWKNICIKDFCVEMKSGGTPSRSNPEYWNIKEVPWLKTGEVKNNIILSTEEYISNKGLNNSSAKILPKDSVLMSLYGVNAGEIGILKIEASTNQACCGMICKNDYQSSYLYYHLLENQEFIASQAIGGAQENLSKDFVEKFPILKPKNEILEKKGLKNIIDNKEQYTKENKKLTELKELLLSRLVTVKN